MFNFVTGRIRFIAFILMLVPMDPPSLHTGNTFVLPEPAQPSNEQQLRSKMSTEQCVSPGETVRRALHAHTHTQVNTHGQTITQCNF